MGRRAAAVPFEMMDELLESLGGVSPKRVRVDPPPGTATEADVLRILDRTNRLFELVDGTLVEKVMGAKESFIAIELAILMGIYQRAHGDRGMILGSDGTLRIMPGMVRIPDVSFTFWDRLPGRRVPVEPIPPIAPDLAVEVLSPGNTTGEMNRKLREYFLSGVREVWFIDPDARTARLYRGPEQVERVEPDGEIDGGELLPGFRLPLADLFAKLTPDAAPPAARPKAARRKKPKK